MYLSSNQSVSVSDTQFVVSVSLMQCLSLAHLHKDIPFSSSHDTVSVLVECEYSMLFRSIMCEELQRIQAGNSPALRVKCESIVFNELPTATRDRFLKQVLPLVRGECGNQPCHSNDMS